MDYNENVYKQVLVNNSSVYKFVERRSCNDILFLIIFLSYWIGMIYLAIYGSINGNPTKLIAPY